MKRLTKKDLEEQRDQLLQEILTLVKNEDFLKVAEIKYKYQTMIYQEATMWHGNIKNEKSEGIKLNTIMPIGTQVIPNRVYINEV